MSESLAQPKTAAEYRVERLTWFGLVGILVVSSAIPEWLALHHGVTPLLAGFLLLLSGIYQYRKGWRVGLSSWAGGIIALVLAGINFLSRPDLDLSLLVILIAVIIIALGIFTREN